jgi:hypothetical protein
MVTDLTDDSVGLFVVSHTHLDLSLCSLPSTDYGQKIYTVYGRWEQYTVHAGIYLAGGLSNRCTIEYPLQGHPFEEKFVEAIYCKDHGDVLEDCDCDWARRVTRRVHDPLITRVQRHPRALLVNTPFYNNARMRAYFGFQLRRIEPSHLEVEDLFQETYVNRPQCVDISIVQQMSGVFMSPYEWTQSHMVYLPDGFTVDRRCNRDK